MKGYRLFIVMVAAALMSACNYSNTKVEFGYSNPERYSVGDAEIAQPVGKINVDWYSGSIVLRNVDRTSIRIAEESDSTLSEQFRVRHYVDEKGKLDIQFCEKGEYRHGELKGLNKRLYIDVPRGMNLEEIEINTVLGVLRIDSVLSRELSVNAVKTVFDAYYPELPDEIEINGVNTKAVLHVPSTAGLTVEMETVNSELNSELPVGKNGKKTVVGDGSCEVEVNAVNGSLNIKEL